MQPNDANTISLTYVGTAARSVCRNIQARECKVARRKLPIPIAQCQLANTSWFSGPRFMRICLASASTPLFASYTYVSKDTLSCPRSDRRLCTLSVTAQFGLRYRACGTLSFVKTRTMELLAEKLPRKNFSGARLCGLCSIKQHCPR
jgi:hypothetical protein